MGVVVPAQKGEVVEVGWSAVYAVQDVVTVAPGGWVGAAGEGASAVSGDQRHSLAFGGEPLRSAEC